LVAGHATDIEEGVEQAARSIDEGAAQRALTGLVACSRQA
jgi:anthranilate phosphoribosyltransferase